MRRRLISAIFIACLGISAGCSDPHSQHRIKMREESMRGLAGDIQALERHRSQRLNEMGPQIKKWWKQDVDLWQERAPTVGDYVW